jgi:hypothetical protein
LNEADLASLLVDYAPSSKNILVVQYDNVQEVLNNIARQKLPLIQDIRQVPPDKLKFNRLSENVQILLTSGMWVESGLIWFRQILVTISIMLCSLLSHSANNL